MSITHPHTESRWRVVLILVALGTLLVATSVRAEQRRMGTMPPSGVQKVQPRGEEGFDWQRFLGGVIRSQIDSQRRPIPDRRPIRPYPGPEPGYPERVPVRPPGYIRPVYPVYPERVTPSVPDNVVQPAAPQPTVTLKPNVVVSTIPPQPSPLQGRVWEVSGREARCYAMSLGNQVHDALAEVVQRVGKGVANPAEIQALVSQVQQLVEKDADWREIEPEVRNLMEQHRSAFQDASLEQIQRAVQMLMVRDAFRVAWQSGPRSRGMWFEVGLIPVGFVWIVHDPTLAVGTALFVNDQVLVCGGGEGDLFVTRGTVAEALGLPVGVGDPVPDIQAKEARELQEAITIHHKADAATPLNYVLNSRQNITIQPGHTQKLSPDREWMVTFDRGAGHGTAKYRLVEGCYEFRIVEGHWELFKLKFEVTIDNREGQQDFVYVLNNEVVSVPAGKTRTHEGSETVIVEFDRGAGPEEPARKNLNKSGTYKVAVNTENNYLDLFAEEQAG